MSALQDWCVYTRVFGTTLDSTQNDSPKNGKVLSTFNLNVRSFLMFSGGSIVLTRKRTTDETHTDSELLVSLF